VVRSRGFGSNESLIRWYSSLFVIVDPIGLCVYGCVVGLGFGHMTSRECLVA
jgi:hypothetical protein